MKVVLFCGGQGMRIRDYSEAIPKPMVQIGCRPILWHVMKYYAHFGHADFIVCLGWKGEVIKNYFLHYDECLSNDFVLSRGGKNVDLLQRDIDAWRITFVDTGTLATIGERLLAVASYLDGEETFLANYADGLTDLPLPRLIDFFAHRRATAAFVSVRPRQSFHAVEADVDGMVRAIRPIAESNVWVNGGYFVFRKEIFNYLRPGEDLLGRPLDRLTAEGRLATLRYDGFWGCMDTFKEKQQLDEMYERGETPWAVWRNGQPDAPGPACSPWFSDLPDRPR